jgi:hypothetical protein
MAATISHPNAPIRVALLVCGAPIPAVAEPYGEYPAIFNNLLQDGLKELKERKAVDPDTELILEGFDVREEIYPENLSDYDGVVITGSGMCHLFCSLFFLASVFRQSRVLLLTPLAYTFSLICQLCSVECI